MRIKKITSQHRRDFYATLECQGCQKVTYNQSGYDDSFYLNEVIPALKCPSCGQSTNDLGFEEPTVEPTVAPHIIL